MLALSGCSSTGTSSGASTNASVSARTADPAKVARQKTERDEDFINPAAMAHATRTGEVYLMRGLMDIFSRGMDVMAAKLRRKGVYAVSTSYTKWQDIAHYLVKRAKTNDISYPLVIMGHSLGGNDAPKLANYLAQRGIEVSYLVTFDPTRPGHLGKNIDRVVNFYLPHDDDNRLYKAAGFKGKLVNISMAGKEGISHTTIEKSTKLQNEVISRILSMTQKKR